MVKFAFLNSFIKIGVFFSIAVDAEAEENVCSIQCDSLNMGDYRDLLWTAAAELPGESVKPVPHHRIVKILRGINCLSEPSGAA